MLPTLQTRKPIDSLTPSDLATFPLWRFLEDDGEVQDADETWVRPFVASEIPGDCHLCLVAATLTTSSGRVFPGLVSVTTIGGFEGGHASMLFGDRYIFVPMKDMASAQSLYHQIEDDLGMVGDIFPLTYELTLPVAGENFRRTGSFGR